MYPFEPDGKIENEMKKKTSIICLCLGAFVVAATPAPSAAQAVTDSDPFAQLGLPRLTPFVLPGGDSLSDADRPSLRNVQLDAFLVEGGQPLEHGLVWRVFHPMPDTSGTLPMLATAEGGRASFEFEPGDYFVHVSFGLAGVTRKLSVPAEGPIEDQSFILNAGGLMLNAVSGDDGRIPEGKLRFSIYAEELDINDQRQLIIADIHPNQVVRLNGGIYHIVSKYGSVNAIIRSDIRVEAGKLTEATIQHRAAQLTLKLVAEEGGEAIADTAWSITNASGDLISESVGAFPSMVLAEGSYTVTARHKERLLQRDFTVVAGQNTDVEVLLN